VTTAGIITPSFTLIVVFVVVRPYAQHDQG